MTPIHILQQRLAIALVFLLVAFLQAAEVQPKVRLDGPYDIRTLPEDLSRPNEFADTPGPGKVFMDQIANPKFFPKGRPASPSALQGHPVYLPTNWEKGKLYPVIFEYLGNNAGVQSLKGVGYGLVGVRDFIWVHLPIVSAYPTTQNDVTVNWGNGSALANTVEYAKQAVREVCEKWGGDSKNCVLVGASRGGVACNLIGLYDDEIASLWKAMVPCTHYFGDGMDITGASTALGSVDSKAVAKAHIARLGKIAQLYVAEYNTDIPTGNPNQLIAKIDEAGCKNIGEAIAKFNLKPAYDSSRIGTRAFIEKNKPAGSSVTFFPLPWVNHDGSIFSLRQTPEREFIRNWIRTQVGLP